MAAATRPSVPAGEAMKSLAYLSMIKCPSDWIRTGIFLSPVKASLLAITCFAIGRSIFSPLLKWRSASRPGAENERKAYQIAFS
jgi:hypothetical protein